MVLTSKYDLSIYSADTKIRTLVIFTPHKSTNLQNSGLKAHLH